MAWDVREIPPPGPPAESEPEPYTGTRRRFRLVNRPMSVRVSARFFDPVKVEYTRSFDASTTFQPTSEICDALLRRVEHCSEELITRKDASALEPGPDKPPRFEISYQFADAPCPTTEKVITSYQERPSDMNQATEVILAIDRMIGLFFLRHDKDFKWVSGPVKEHISGKPRTAKPGGGGPESLACVPRCRFFPSSQSYEFVPGYQVELSFSSTCTTRRPLTISKTLRLSSGQCSPLNLPIGEDMLSAATEAINAAVDSRKRTSVGFRWLAATNDTVSIDLRIKNNLGPDHKNLTYSLETKERLFSSPNGLDCIMFLDQVYRSLSRVTDRVDDAIGTTHELEVKILEVRGARWEAVEPLSVFLDSTISYSRRTVEAILDRVHTGVASILHGNDNAITLSIYHRGHLVLDKTLIAHEDTAVVKRPSLPMTPKQEGNRVISRLADRIREDIAMICRDTCALDIRGYALPNLGMVQSSRALRVAEPVYAEVPHQDAPQQQAMYDTPPPSRHSNALMKDAAVTSGPVFDAPSTPQPRTPYRSERHPAEEEDMDLTPPSTPSLIDGDLDTPRDSVLITPPAGIKPGQGMSELSGYGPQIVDDDAGVHDPIVRDFAGLSHAASVPKGYYSERMLPISKSDRHFGGPLVPHDTPTPTRNIVVVSEDESEDLHDSPSKPRIRTKEHPEQPSPLKPDQASLESETALEPALGDWPEILCKPLDLDQRADTTTETTPEKDEVTDMVLEGWLEYRCDPLEPLDQEAGTVVETTPKEDESTDTVLEGWLEYRCDPLDPLDQEAGTVIETVPEKDESADTVLEGWLEYRCEPLDQEEAGAVTETSFEKGEATETVLEGWLEYMCEPLDQESNAPAEEGIIDEPTPTPSPILEGWLEYCCEPLDPEVTTTKDLTTPEELREVTECPSTAAIMVEDRNDNASSNDESTRDTSAPPISDSTETSDSDLGSASSSEVAYTAPECMGEELLLEVPRPDAATTVLYDAPKVIDCGVLPVLLCDMLPSLENDDGVPGAEEDQCIDVDRSPDDCGEPESPLVIAVEAMIDEPLPLDINAEDDQAIDVERDPDNRGEPESLSPAVIEAMVDEPLPLDINAEDDQCINVERGPDNCGEPESPPSVVIEAVVDEPLSLDINAKAAVEVKDDLLQISDLEIISPERGSDADASGQASPGDEPLPLDTSLEATAESKDHLVQIADPETILLQSVSDTDASGQANPPAHGDESLPLDANLEATVESKGDLVQIADLETILPESGSVTSASGQSNPPTPEDEPMPAFFQDTSVAKGKEVAPDIESGEPSGPSPEAEDVEVARAVADIIDTAFERSQEVGQSKDAMVEVEQRLEAGDEISQLASDIDAAFEWHTMEEPAKDVQTPGMWPGEDDDGDALEITNAIAEIDAAVDKAGGTMDKPLGDVEQPIPGAYEMVDDEISQAVAEIEAAVVKSSATLPREDMTRKVLESALKEKDSLDLAQAIAEIDAAVERRLVEREKNAKERRNHGGNSKALKTIPALNILVPPPRSDRRLARASHQPSSPILRPTTNLPAFSATRTASLPRLFIPRLDTLPREAIPFSGPAHGRKSSVTMAGYAGLRGGHVFPLQDALLGTRSRSGFFGASPVLSCVTAECKSGREVIEGGETEEEVEVEDVVEDVVEERKPREDTPPSTPKMGYGALPGLLFWAAGVTIASSAFRRT